MNLTTAYIRTLSDEIDRARSVLTAFESDLDKNPVFAFRHSETSFEAAARIYVYDYCLTYLKNSAESSALSMLRTYVNSQINRGARNPVRSTSPTDVFIGTSLLSAWADAAELLVP